MLVKLLELLGSPYRIISSQVPCLVGKVQRLSKALYTPKGLLEEVSRVRSSERKRGVSYFLSTFVYGNKLMI